jgi:hypothetical protein
MADYKALTKQFLQPISWLRTIVILVIAGLIIWKIFIAKTETTHVVVKPGATYAPVTNEAAIGHPLGRIMFPYYDISVGRNTESIDKWGNASNEFQARVGIRGELDGLWNWMFRRNKL